MSVCMYVCTTTYDKQTNETIRINNGKPLKRKLTKRDEKISDKSGG